MKKPIFTFLLSFFVIASYCQIKETSSKLNLDFEIAKKGNPTDWSKNGNSNYILALDSTTVKSGKYSASIEYRDGKPNFDAWSFIIPNNYAGKKMTLSGYIKTENVTEGYAGLAMRISPDIAYDNMKKNGVKGTTDWTKYEITLDMNPQKTTQFIVGGLLVGKGKMWIDDFKVTIDGKDINYLKPFEKKIVFPAEKDREFDNGSQISNISVDKNQVENLKDLGLIWGFLKYYHPNIAKGEYNWDYELFRILPQVMNSPNRKNRDEVLAAWIKKLGEFSQGNEFKIDSAKVKLSPDLNWITNSNYSEELTTLLLKVKSAKRSKNNYYIDLYPDGNAEFKNENTYSSMKYPDAGFRILTLYRYWNMIQYYFPYKNLIEEDWKNVLAEFIPKVITAKNQTDYTLTTIELIGRINDTHANIWGGNPILNNHFGLNFAPVAVSFIENKAVVTGFHDQKLGKETGLEIGDVISSINNKPVEEIVKEKLNYTPASNYPTKLREIGRYLLRTNDSTLNIKFVRNNKTESKTIKTFPTNEIDIYSRQRVKNTCFKVINQDIAYINNGALKIKDTPNIWGKIQNKKGIIIDLRNYPSQFSMYALGRYLMPERAPFVKITTVDIKNPGYFTYVRLNEVGQNRKDYYKGKVILLVNEETQSMAEYHAMGYKINPNTTLIGSTTAGADGNTSPIYLPGGILTMISGIGVYYPDGKETQRIGIVPDIEVKPTIQGVKEGRDEVLEKAIEIITEAKSAS